MEIYALKSEKYAKLITVCFKKFIQHLIKKKPPLRKRWKIAMKKMLRL